MGGPMNIYEEDKYPWLSEEKIYILKAIHAGKFVLGICLGAQLLADVLGARVFPGAFKEIGWFPITLTDEAGKTDIFTVLTGNFPVFHWHGDTFFLPEGAGFYQQRVPGAKTRHLCMATGFLVCQFTWNQPGRVSTAWYETAPMTLLKGSTYRVRNRCFLLPQSISKG